MKVVLLIMAGIGFTVGLLFGLVLQLPSDVVLSEDSVSEEAVVFRSRRDLQSPHQSDIVQVFRQDILPKPDSHKSADNVNSKIYTKPLLLDVRNTNFRADSGNDSALITRNENAGKVELTVRPVYNSEDSVTVQIRLNVNGGNSNSGSKEASDPKTQDPLVPLREVVSGIVWSSSLEGSCPQGFRPSDLGAWQRKVWDLPVVRLEEGCGRMQNRLVTFRDASQACARYRLNTDQLQGEIYSFYLARLLNMTANFPPTTMLHVRVLDPQWRQVHLDLAQAQWVDDHVTIVTQWVKDLSPAYIPQELREDSRRVHPVEGLLRPRSRESWCELLQWSDLIVFDYLTANLDRVVNNMFNHQWNDEMMNSPTHNLERTPSGSLVFLDNESGLFHGYRLLDKYESYNRAMLQSLCVFRGSTVRAVRSMSRSGHIGEELYKLFSESERLHKKLPRIPDKNIKILKQRLKDVEDQIFKCEQMFAR